MAKRYGLDNEPQSSSLTVLRSNKINKCLKTSMSVPEYLGEERKRMCAEAFKNWLCLKKEEQQAKREREWQLRKINEEQIKIKREEAEICYELWKRNKDRQIKAKEMKDQQLKKEYEVQNILKQQTSRERVSQWMTSSKHKPRPVPCNKGLLSLTGSNPPSFYNPHPWVSPI